VLAAGPEGIDVACGEGVLRLLALQPAGGRSMQVKDFLNGRRVVAGDRFL
jgi:methionyl-tRNA formyltransferase